MKDLAIVLVGLNARDFVLDCLRSIEEAGWREVSYEVIYVDNGSRDGSAEAVADQFPAVRLVANDSNLGYCPAANQGARLSDARYYYFINDDTLVVDDALALLVEYADQTDKLGTVGSRLVYPDGSEQYSGRRFPRFWASVFGRRSWLTRLLPGVAPVQDYLCTRELAAGEPFDVDWVSAAGQLVPRDAFWDVGGFAEDYYYWHEAVFCDRLTRRGLRVVLHPDSRVIHYEGKGSGPRPPKVQRFHITNFHQGAFRAYCERYSLGRLSPTYWLVGAALLARATLLYAGTFLPRARSGA